MEVHICAVCLRGACFGPSSLAPATGSVDSLGTSLGLGTLRCSVETCLKKQKLVFSS